MKENNGIDTRGNRLYSIPPREKEVCVLQPFEFWKKYFGSDSDPDILLQDLQDETSRNNMRLGNGNWILVSTEAYVNWMCREDDSSFTSRNLACHLEKMAAFAQQFAGAPVYHAFHASGGNLRGSDDDYPPYQ